MYTMRFDLRVPGMKPDKVADQYEAAIQMAEYGEQNGCLAVIMSEHHSSPDGYMPTPLIMATAMAARTTTLPIVIGAALLPLYDPVRLAEEMIVLDNLSRGRVSYIFGIGYRPEEYELFRLPYAERGKLADERLAIVLGELAKASSGDDPARITPAPYTPGGPHISWGGGSKVAARRAGRNGLDFFGSGREEGMEEAYATAAREAGHEPGAWMVPQPEKPYTLFVSDDQDGAWDEIGEYLLHDVVLYAEWNDDSLDVASLSYSKDVPSLREERGAHQIMTVDEAVAYVGTDFMLPLHPLCGGVPADVAWPYLRRVVDEVMPRLADAGGVQ